MANFQYHPLKAVFSIVLLWLLLAGPSGAQQTYIQKGSEPLIPNFPHITVVSPFLDFQMESPGQGGRSGGISIYGYYPDLLDGKLKFSGMYSNTILDLNLSTKLPLEVNKSSAPKEIEVGFGFAGELISAENTLFVYSKGRRLHPFEFYTTEYGGKLFGRYPLSETGDMMLTQQVKEYHFRASKDTEVVLPGDTLALATTFEMSSVQKEITAELEELSGWEYSAFLNYEWRERVEEPSGANPLRAISSRQFFKGEGYFLNFFSPSERQRIRLGLSGGIGSNLDFVSRFRLGSFLEGQGNTALPGYYFSELRADSYLLGQGTYTWVFSPDLKFSLEAAYGISNNFLLPQRSRKAEAILGLALGFQKKVYNIPFEIKYGYAPLARRGDRRGGNEIFLGTFLAF
ncbi:MAG: hypothetical protein HY998_06815 [candidate division NC10 bacterium]|nr:hypothetical protein [candidate division NC10 bacterium]